MNRKLVDTQVVDETHKKKKNKNKLAEFLRESHPLYLDESQVVTAEFKHVHLNDVSAKSTLI